MSNTGAKLKSFVYVLNTKGSSVPAVLWQLALDTTLPSCGKGLKAFRLLHAASQILDLFSINFL